MHICQEGAGKGDIIVMRSLSSKLIIVAMPDPSPKIKRCLRQPVAGTLHIKSLVCELQGAECRLERVYHLPIN
ncbi:MAG: hypothetical protein KME22_24395 [Hassallia sp. WJT32-NPBG1]|nr:hypothetical protein [Hassallia sp. WJT32-NPBG1]